MNERQLLPHAPASDLTFISIVIPVFNEASFIEQTLSQLDDQSYPKHLFEVFVVDGGSTDATCELVRRWMVSSRLNIKILYNPKRISSCARNLGIDAANGEYILFIDAHVFIPSVDLLTDMALAACEQKAMVLGRAQPLTPPILSGFQKMVADVRASKLGHSLKSYIYSDFEGWVSPVSVGVMYHRSLLDNAVRFDEGFDAAEDVEFNFRLESEGHRAYMSPDFKIFYYPRKNFSGLAKQMFRYGIGRARFTNKHFDGCQAELLGPIAVFLATLGSLAFVLVSGWSATLFASGLAMYCIAMLVLFQPFARVKYLTLAPVCLVAIHMCLAVGLIFGTLQCFMRSLTTSAEKENEFFKAKY